MQAVTASMGGRVAVFVYGVIAYLLFFASITYMIGFVGGYVVPKSVNDGNVGDASTSVMINVLLFGAFAAQHAIMARPWFKRSWSRVLPAIAERSTFVAAASLLLFLLYWQWRPLPTVVWSVEVEAARTLLHGLSILGWALVFYSSFCIDHFDLFGLRHVYFYLRGRPYTHPGFAQPRLYRLVRNPLMLGFLIAFWSAPTMSQGRLLFCIITTLYILVGIRMEERDLSAQLGEAYRRYRARTPMLLPIPWGRGKGESRQATHDMN